MTPPATFHSYALDLSSSSVVKLIKKFELRSPSDYRSLMHHVLWMEKRNELATDVALVFNSTVSDGTNLIHQKVNHRAGYTIQVDSSHM